MGANHGEGAGGPAPIPPKLTPKRKTAKTTLRYREIHDSYIKAGIHPEFFQRELAAAKPRRVSKSRLQPANHSHFSHLRSSVRTSLREIPSVNPLLHALFCHFG